MIERMLHAIAVLLTSKETRSAAIECQCQTKAKVAEQSDRIDTLLGAAQRTRGLLGRIASPPSPEHKWMNGTTGRNR